MGLVIRCSVIAGSLALFSGPQAAQSVRPTTVSIDVKPGDTPTTIERARGGFLPVAVISTVQFDALTLDRETVRIGPTGTEATPARSMASDVDEDGRMDLMLLVRVTDLRITCDVKVIRLTATTTSGEAVEGSESVAVEGCGLPRRFPPT